ncbi:hypothetical protein [Nocardiopsis dassonvillei]|uniref:hypothetical protein n=1 Tax=Nocardiopsis dassonvillei TaxID=2014 RepID=UPI00363362B0
MNTDPDRVPARLSRGESYVQLHGTWYRIADRPEVYLAAVGTPEPEPPRYDPATCARAAHIVSDWLDHNHPKRQP